jgi:hypothetical protein
VTLRKGQSIVIATQYAIYFKNKTSTYISSNSNSKVATAMIRNGYITIKGVGIGTNTVTICSNTDTTCGTLSVTSKAR